MAVHVRRHVLAWLRSGDPRRGWVRRHGPAVATAALAGALLVAGANPTGQSGPWNAGEDDEFYDEEFDGAEDGEFDDASAPLVPG